MRRVLFLTTFLFAIAIPVMAQDPVKVDSKHYKVEFENATRASAAHTLWPA